AFVDVLLENRYIFDTASLCQLYQWDIWQKEERHSAGLPSELKMKCYVAFTSQEFHTSGFQKDVVSVLRSIGLNPREEVLTPRGFSLDALVEIDGKQVGVEMDGPSHFIDRKPKGKTIIKRRHVTNVEGVTLVSVPYWEWSGLFGCRHHQKNYLRSILGL
ncbi:hypothetical protein ACHAXR_003063, partial [Thalassiosira sp. AJA248-18]